MDEFTPLNLFGSEDDEKKEDTSSVTVDSNKEDEKDEANDVKVEVEYKTESEEEINSDPEETSAEDNDGVKQDELSLSESYADEAKKNESSPDEESSDKIDKVLDVQQQLLERLETLEVLFNTRIMHTDHEEKIVDQMHKELQKYKEDMYAQLVRPILLDVIEVRDSIMRIAASYLTKPEGEQNIPNKTFSDYAFDLQDILEKNSVEIYRSKSGDEFTPIKQRVIKKIATDVETLHGKVAESLSCGYSYNGRTISAEKITIYYYEESQKNNEKSEVIENG